MFSHKQLSFATDEMPMCCQWKFKADVFIKRNTFIPDGYHIKIIWIIEDISYYLY